MTPCQNLLRFAELERKDGEAALEEAKTAKAEAEVLLRRSGEALRKAEKHFRIAQSVHDEVRRRVADRPPP